MKLKDGIVEYLNRNEENLYYCGEFLLGTVATVGGIAGIVQGISKINSGDRGEGINDIVLSFIPLSIGLKYSSIFALKTYYKLKK